MRLLALVAITAAVPAAADPVRLRADALATTASPAGLLVLEADGASERGLSAEAVVWLGGQRVPAAEASGDVLVIAVKARDRRNRAMAQVGRFVSTLGALRPVQIDGASGRVALPSRIVLEATAGIPVLATRVDESRAWDWIAGGRVARRIGDYGSIGIAYAQRRDAGRLYTEELGADAGFAIDSKHDAGARLAYDLAGDGLAELGVSASRRVKRYRVELYARHRAASHLLPATSLFTVLGDVPSQQTGGVITWRAAPRLDVITDVAARKIDDDLGEELTGRARLRLDDKGASLASIELRRVGGTSDAWTGARAALRFEMPRGFGVATELELVRPDVDRGTGTLWPWGLVAVSYRTGAWDGAVAVEASSSLTDRYRVDGLLQLARRWDVP